jgi:hypothetical protein
MGKSRRVEKGQRGCGIQGFPGKRKLLARGQFLGLGALKTHYLFKELIHKVISVHVDHLFLIITVFRLGGKGRTNP